MDETSKHTATALSYKTQSLSHSHRRIAVGMLGALLFAGLTFVGARIHIPLQPVPITLQTLFVVLGGAILGTRFGALGQGFYIGVGALGVPVFAESVAGFGVLAGPTGGYLLGFLVAPAFVGYSIRRHSAFWWQFVVFFFGSLIILSLGVLHLTLFYTHDLLQSLRVGYLPFVPGDLLKILAAVSIYRSYRALRKSSR